MIEQLLSTFIEEFEVEEEIQEEGRNRWVFFYTPDLAITFEEQGEWIHIHCEICAAPEKIEKLERMLEANALGFATFDAILGLDHSAEVTTLRKDLKANCDYHEFVQAVEDFIEVTEFWYKFLGETQEKEVAQI